MAHEMSHVYMQHSASRRTSKQTLAQILGAVVGFSATARWESGRAGIQFGAGTVLMKYSRGRGPGRLCRRHHCVQSGLQPDGTGEFL